MVTDYRNDATWQEGDDIAILKQNNIFYKMIHAVAYSLSCWLNSPNKAYFEGLQLGDKQEMSPLLGELAVHNTC